VSAPAARGRGEGSDCESVTVTGGAPEWKICGTGRAGLRTSTAAGRCGAPLPFGPAFAAFLTWPLPARPVENSTPPFVRAV
jgi:hypothetical protein